MSEGGRWEGDRFIFDEPVDLGGGCFMEEVDFSTFVPEDPTITRDDVIYVLRHPFKIVEVHDE